MKILSLNIFTKRILPGLVCFFSFLFMKAQLALLPYPQKVMAQKDSLDLSRNFMVALLYDSSLNAFTPQFVTKGSASKNVKIICRLKSSLTKKLQGHTDGYVLRITKKKIEIEAPNPIGFYYAAQTLKQLLAQFDERKKIPCLEITDYPQFQWRGMHLDCSRHFFSVEEVKRYIDMLAMYKLNVFHWHLTDDQGWRIEIKKYPKLTQVGAWRNGSMIGPYKNDEFDTITYGGFYTQEEIKEIVKYASSQFITVVPEIEMPGHSMAALASYPELACIPHPFQVAKEWGVFDDVYCTKNATIDFIRDVLDEVCALFPSSYIHIGGDECPKTRWKNCEQCQLRIKTLGLKDENELQSWFVQTMEKHVNAKGKKIIGWDEILEGGLAPNAAVMSWRGEQGGLAAANLSHPVVMTPGGYCYFDHYQDTPVSKEPLAIGGYTSLAKVYSYNPIPALLPAEKARYIMGAQGNVWTEYITSFAQVQYMSNPRMIALSEVLWSYPPTRDYEGFKKRLLIHSNYLSQLNINYCKDFILR